MLPEVTAVVFIPLSGGGVAVVDFEDYEMVRGFTWFRHPCKNTTYARGYRLGSGKKGKRILMHRLLLSATSKIVLTDHKDGNGLNNQRYNIRLCSSVQNQQAFRTKRPGASSRFRGVCWASGIKMWRADLSTEKGTYFLGNFFGEENAARAYDKKAREIFGEFASPNFP